MRAMAARIGARLQEVARVLEEPLSETLPRTLNFASVVLQNHPNSPGVLTSEAAMPSNAAKIIEPSGKKRELHYAPSGPGQERP
jgi:hypothetical protein